MGTPVALSQALSGPIYPHANRWAWVYMQMISIFGHTCRTVAGSLRPHTPMPIHWPGCICKWFPYLGTPVTLSQAFSGPIYPHANTWAWVYMQMISIFGHTCRTVAGFFRAYIPSCQYMGPGVYANGFHIWAHLSHCRRLSHPNTWAQVYMQMVSIYGHTGLSHCRRLSQAPYPHPNTYK